MMSSTTRTRATTAPRRRILPPQVHPHGTVAAAAPHELADGRESGTGDQLGHTTSDGSLDSSGESRMRGTDNPALSGGLKSTTRALSFFVCLFFVVVPLFFAGRHTTRETRGIGTPRAFFLCVLLLMLIFSTRKEANIYLEKRYVPLPAGRPRAPGVACKYKSQRSSGGDVHSFAIFHRHKHVLKKTFALFPSLLHRMHKI